MKEFSGLADDNGEISKTDLIVHTKASKFWKEYMQAKAKPGGLISKVHLSFLRWSLWSWAWVVMGLLL